MSNIEKIAGMAFSRESEYPHRCEPAWHNFGALFRVRSGEDEIKAHYIKLDTYYTGRFIAVVDGESEYIEGDLIYKTKDKELYCGYINTMQNEDGSKTTYSGELFALPVEGNTIRIKEIT